MGRMENGECSATGGVPAYADVLLCVRSSEFMTGRKRNARLMQRCILYLMRCILSFPFVQRVCPERWLKRLSMNLKPILSAFVFTVDRPVG